MNKLEVAERLNTINKQAVTTYSGSIIKLVQMLCDLIGDLCEELEEVRECACHYDKLQVPSVPKEFFNPANPGSLPKPELPKSKHKTTKQAKKGTANKAKTNSRQ